MVQWNFLKLTSTTLAILPLMVACKGGGLESTPDANLSSQSTSVEANSSSQDESLSVHPFDINQYALNKVVCDPMGDPANPGLYDGLTASLYYLKADQPRYKRVADYLQYGHKTEQQLFFTELNVPTRLFSEGFPKETGGVIEDDLGQPLFEYFALRFKSVLKLAPDQEEGEYELALLSDDGSMMTITNEAGESRVVVDNDNQHTTRMGCGERIHMTHDSLYDVTIDYFQAPRLHIAMVPLWRKVSADTQADPECGKSGNDRYFDYRAEVTQPKQPYLDLLARAWKPIAAANWKLPYMAQYNPCFVPVTAPVISGFQVIDGGERAIVRWQTDLPATSQVLVRNSAGEETLTRSDNVLRTSHEVILSEGISLGVPYTFQGISVTADMGRSLSEPVVLTLRAFNL